MAKSALETIKEQKVSHAEEVIEALKNVRATVNKYEELWFGGHSPALSQAAGMCDFQIQNIRATFNIEDPDAPKPLEGGPVEATPPLPRPVE